jgi:hypothetical protein
MPFDDGSNERETQPAPGQTVSRLPAVELLPNVRQFRLGDAGTIIGNLYSYSLSVFKGSHLDRVCRLCELDRVAKQVVKSQID